jgi:UDP-N-acetylmuramoyl-tripeptide--D-alanyl-D-alanine ligase
MTKVKNKLFTAAEAALWACGKLVGNPEAVVTDVVVDSRDCGPGTLFVALKGENTDGHNYISQVFGKGSCGAVVSEKWLSENENIKVPAGSFLLSTAEPLDALQKTAAAYLRGIKHPVRIGVTGSNGKTTTKELIAGVLSEKYSVVKTDGNYNSEIGLPLTVFNIKESHDYAVIEMGINRVGEMDVLTEILRPDIVVITNIGTAHIGVFKTREVIAYEKRRALSLFDGEGVLFLDEDVDYKDFLTEDLAGRAEFFGLRNLTLSDRIFSAEANGLNGWIISLDGCEIKFPLIGEHNLKNAVCALRVGEAEGVAPELCRQALEKAEPLFGRGQIIEGSVTIIQDCYNSNADSLISSISFADELKWAGAKKYIIGDMKELGESSMDIHKAAGRVVAEGPADEVFFFGEDAEVSYNEACSILSGRNGAGPRLFWTIEYEQLETELFKSLSEGDLLLLKASRSMSLERLVQPVVKYNRGKKC